ncbi:MAG TPA: carboxypeptidase-like regulatory domain-containing protein, partial [Planctomycetota bacterium]|nr:carboxypeptidase-like regulatory domain-containing protein [Planctomycetota bacterium]
MSRRSSSLLPILLLLLAAGVGVAAWAFLRDSASKPADPNFSAELASSKATEEGALDAIADAPANEDADDSAASARSASERRAQATAAEAELDDALWIDGRVVFPDGTSPSEVVEVVALGRKFKNREMHRVKVASDGKFRVAFAPGTKSGRLDVDALHLFLDKPLTVRLADGKPAKEIVLEPFLGGALRGRLRLALGAENLAPELVGKSLHATAWSNRWSNMVSRSAKVDKDLRFELRGLPPELGLRLEFDSNIVTKLSVDGVRAPAGETLEQEFELALGVRVRGHVRSPEGAALPKGTTLNVSVKADKVLNDYGGMSGDGRDTGKIADDGTFDLRGLLPGEITLTAAAPQRVTIKLPIGRLENGAVKEGVELVLGLGHSVSGRVVWPDKSPAVDANVVATGGGGDDDPFNPFDNRFAVRTNASGEFQIAGLNEGPYGLLAQAKPPSSSKPGGRKGQTWKARLEGVTADTRGLEVELVAGYSVEGKVVDDVGAPVTAFGVVAMAKDVGKRSFNISRMVSGMFKPEDGQFELGGLLEGGYTLNLNVPGHDDPSPLDVTVPNDGALYTFVAPRRGSISGVVVRPDGSPAPRAEVTVDGEQGRWSQGGQDKADNHGKFDIKAAQTGKITISAKLDGFAPSEVVETELVSGQSIADLRLRLRVGGRIHGEVLPSKSGERVDGRKVTAQQPRVNNQGGESFDTTTDRAGKFEFAHVTPGEYTVAAEAAATELDQLRDPRNKRGNDWELMEMTKKRGKVSVTDGGTARIVLGAAPAAPVVISGRVHRGSEGAADVRIVAQGDGEQGYEKRKLARTGDDGRYEVTVDEPGKYQVQATPAGRGGTLLGTHVDVPSSGLADVDFALSSGRIAGKVEGPDGEELGWVQVRISRAPVEGEKGSQWTGGNTQTDSAGEFEFSDLPAGNFTLEVSGQSWNRRTFEQRQYGKVKKEVVLADGQELTGVAIRLEAAGTLKVSVLMADGSIANSGRMSVRRT